MITKNLCFLPRDTRPHNPSTMALREYHRIKGKSLKHILHDRFLNHYGYDKGTITASAIVDDILTLIEQFFRFNDNFLSLNGVALERDLQDQFLSGFEIQPDDPLAGIGKCRNIDSISPGIRNNRICSFNIGNISACRSSNNNIRPDNAFSSLTIRRQFLL